MVITIQIGHSPCEEAFNHGLPWIDCRLLVYGKPWFIPLKLSILRMVNHGNFTMVYHGKSWYTMVALSVVNHGKPWYTMVKYHGKEDFTLPWYTMNMVKYGIKIPWYFGPKHHGKL